MGQLPLVYFSGRTPVQFFCIDVPSLSITISGGTTLANNMAVYVTNVGTVAKIDQGLDSRNYYRGDGEYPPILELEWKQMAYTDYLKLAQLRPYFVEFITYRNVGFYGKLVMNQPTPMTKVADVVSAKGMFSVLSPNDLNGAQTVNRIPDPSGPTSANSNTAGTGYIASGVPNYYWLTFSSVYGETNPIAATGNGTGNISSAQSTNVSLAWTWPTSTYCTQASLYVSNSNSTTTANKIADIVNGLPPFWIDYVGFQGAIINKRPPVASTAYRGRWCAGTWINETP